MFGEWRERFGAETGVVTVTRGEGGGNAIGPEEGPALGLIREREEREAVGTLGVTDVYNLDKVDFYYSVSAPLHQEAWNAARDPRPAGAGHARDPARGRHDDEPGAQPGQPRRAPGGRAAGDRGLRGRRRPGPLPRTRSPARACGLGGEEAAHHRGAGHRRLRRAELPDHATPRPTRPTTSTASGPAASRAAARPGRSSSARPSAPTPPRAGRASPTSAPTPRRSGCDFVRQIDSRVPFVRGDLTADAAPSSTILEGAVLPSTGGLPLGTGLDVSTDAFEVVPGGSTDVDVVADRTRAASACARTRVALDLPQGWTGAPVAGLGRVGAGDSVDRSFTVTAPATRPRSTGSWSAWTSLPRRRPATATSSSTSYPSSRASRSRCRRWRSSTPGPSGSGSSSCRASSSPS